MAKNKITGRINESFRSAVRSHLVETDLTAIRNLSPAEVEDAKDAHNDPKYKGNGMNGFRHGDHVSYNNEHMMVTWPFQADDSAPGGSTLTLVSPDFKRLAQNVPITSIQGIHRPAKNESVNDVGDPTKQEMMDYLRSQWGSEEGWEDEAEVAIYYFANDWHGGGGSNLYSAMSTSPYRPGPYSSLESEGGLAAEMYQDLESKFAK